jgi:Flp pilus assembly pilin Flp
VQEFVTFHRIAGYDCLGQVVARVTQRFPASAPENHSTEKQKRWQEKRTMFIELMRSLWHEDEGQDIAEYAVMLAVILVIVVGTIRLIGSNANNVFSNVASTMQ